MAALGTDPKLQVGMNKYKLPAKTATKVKAILKKKKMKKRAS